MMHGQRNVKLSLQYSSLKPTFTKGTLEKHVKRFSKSNYGLPTCQQKRFK